MKLSKKFIITITLSTLLSGPSFAQEKSMIPYVSEKDATGEVKEIYAQVKGAFGMIPAPIMQHSVDPDMLKNHWDYFAVAGKNKNFSQKFLATMRMLIATSGSFQYCDYCVDGNAMMLKAMFKMSDKEIKSIQKDPKSAKLSPKEMKMLNFLITATKDPKSLDKTSYNELRQLGWTDKDIFDGLKMATQMVAAIYMVNALKIPSDFGVKK